MVSSLPGGGEGESSKSGIMPRNAIAFAYETKGSLIVVIIVKSACS